MQCFRCGICCARYQVQLSMAEAEHIASGLGLPLKEFIDRYADPRWPGTDSILLRHQNGACVYLEQTTDKETRCLIHHLKPSICREFSANLTQKVCWEGLARYWDLTVSPSGELEGTEKPLARFHAFLALLE